jgi:hypothetical protein
LPPLSILDPGVVLGASACGESLKGAIAVNNAREIPSNAKSDPCNGAAADTGSLPDDETNPKANNGTIAVASQNATSTASLNLSGAAFDGKACLERMYREGETGVISKNKSAELASDSHSTTASGDSQPFDLCLNSLGEAVGLPGRRHSSTANSISTTIPLTPVDRNSVINRANLHDIQRHHNFLEGYQIRLLGMVKRKVDLHPQRYERDSYHETASMLILSNWPSAERLAYCGIPSSVNRGGLCRLHQFCPYCCWKVRTRAQFTYVPSFYRTSWHFLTGSFCGDLRFTGSDGYDWLDYWDAYKAALSDLVKAGLINGAYWTEELAINSLLPTRVLPHIHAIIDADAFTAATKELLKTKTTQYLQSNLGPDVLEPDVRVDAIHEQKGLLDRIGYMNKTVRLRPAYYRDWLAASVHNHTCAQGLNSSLTDLVEGHSQFTRRRKKMNAQGTLNPKDKKFIGVKTKCHGQKQYVDLINELKREPTEFIELVSDEGSLAANA